MMKKVTVVSDEKNALEGWFTAVRLKKELAQSGIEIEHVCAPLDENIKGVVGLSEEVVETLMSLGLQQQHLFNRNIANLWLADRFTNWSRSKSTFYQTQSPIGVDKEGVSFHHFLTPYQRQGKAVDFSDFSLTAAAAKLGKFVLPSSDPKSILSSVNVGLNVDITYLTNILRQLALHVGVKEQIGALASIDRSQSAVSELTLTNGQTLKSDFYFDLCDFNSDTPLRNQDTLIKVKPFKNMKSIQCNTVVEDAKPAAITPLTKYVTTGVGWQRSVRLGKYKYTEIYQTDVRGAVPTESFTETTKGKSVSMTMVKNAWQGNCVTLGSGALDMIEMHGLRLAILNQQIIRWCGHFPVTSDCSMLANAFNQENAKANLYHIVMSQLPFMSNFISDKNQFETMQNINFDTVEDGEVLLEYLCTLFINTGTFPELEYQIKKSFFWVAFMVNMGLMPKVTAPQVERMSRTELIEFVEKVQSKVRKTAESLRN